MSTHPLAKSLAILFTITLVAPTTFFFAPQRAHATVPVAIIADPVGWVEETITAVESTISAIADPISAAAEVAQQVNAYVLQPLAFVLSGNLMKMITAGVIGFVIGKANGTGVPQFAVDVAKSMQTVADGRALAYLRQMNQTKSPFAYSIQSALSTDYLTKSSLAGFWAANMNTLARTSRNVPSYLSGNWSQGGWAAWFSLTTQVQNNPYSLYANSQSQLAGMIGSGVGGVTGARSQELAWGSGFMSWCGTSDEATAASNASITASQSMAGMAPSPVACTSSTESFRDAGGDCYKSAADANAADNINNASQTLGNVGQGRTPEGGIGINPGDPCSKDGIPGTIQTPGSTIKATLDKVLGGQQDQIVRMGNVGPQINQILKDVGTIIGTVKFASDLLGGGGKGGLLSVNSTAASRSISQLAQFTPNQDSSGNFISDYAGVTSTNVYQETANILTDMPGRISKYKSSWDTVTASANTASQSLTSLAQYCTSIADKTALATMTDNTTDSWSTVVMPTTLPSNLSSVHSTFIDAARAQAATAISAITSKIAPVLAKSRTAYSDITAANALLQKTLSAAPSDSTAGSVVTIATLQSEITGFALGKDGNIYTAEKNGAIKKITPTGTVSVLTNVGVNYRPLVIDSVGNLYTITASSPVTGARNTVSKITPTGFVSTFTMPEQPTNLAVDSNDNVYVLGNWDSVTKITASGGISDFIGHLMGGGNLFRGLAIDSSNNVYISAFASGGIYEFDTLGNDVTSIPSVLTRKIILDAFDTLYYLSGGGVMKVDTAGTSHVFATAGTNATLVDGVFDRAGNMYVADGSNDIISKIDTTGRVVATYAVGGKSSALAIGKDGSLYFTTSDTNSVGKIVFSSQSGNTQQTTATVGSSYVTDVQALQNTPPTMIDVAAAMRDSSVTGAAIANPEGSLTVSGGSLVDQMNLLNTNAEALKTTVCNPTSELYELVTG